MGDGIIRSEALDAFPIDRSGPRRDWFGQLQMDDVETTVLAYATGYPVPPGAVYLSTVFTPETSLTRPCVLHYFRVPLTPAAPVERAA